MIQAVGQATQSIVKGYSSYYESKMTAKGYDAQAEVMGIQQTAEAYKFDLFKKRTAGTVIANTAGSGLQYTGSPVEVMLDNMKNIELDKAYALYNIEVEKQGALASSRLAIARGKAARNISWANAFTSLLVGAASGGGGGQQINTGGSAGGGGGFSGSYGASNSASQFTM